MGPRSRFVLLVVAFAALAFAAADALAVPCSTWSDWITTYPQAARRVPPVALVARGSGTNDVYVLEIDPTTCALPVDASLTVDYSGTPGEAVPSEAAYVAGTDGTNLRGLKTDSGGELQVDVLSSALPTGAATLAEQETQTTHLSAIETAVEGTLTVDGSGVTQPISAASLPLPTGAATSANQTTEIGHLAAIETAVEGTLTVQSTNLDIRDLTSASDSVEAVVSAASTIEVENFPSSVATNTGNASASTLRVVAAADSPSPQGRAYADSVRNAYASTNVTTGAWVELIASTAAAINAITLFDSCGQTLELGTGAAASESRVLLIPPGGLDGTVPLRIASGTRVAVKAVSDDCTSGELVLTGLN